MVMGRADVRRGEPGADEEEEEEDSSVLQDKEVADEEEESQGLDPSVDVAGGVGLATTCGWLCG